MQPEEVAQTLCLKCGICCNGVLFKDVELQTDDNPAQLKSLGLPIKSSRAKHNPISKFSQPCCALQEDNSCQIYSNRPSRCAQFECLLFLEVQEGKMAPAKAIRIIKSAKQKAARVEALLNELDSEQKPKALSLRFQKLSRAMEKNPPSNPETLETYGELTMAVHDLNVLLGGAFYP